MSDQELPTIDVHEAARRLEAPGDGPAPLLVDVREVDEFTAQRVNGAVLLPLSRLGVGYRVLPQDRAIMVLCKVGGRSAMATDFLLRQGWPDVVNVAGGITAWSQAGLPTRSGPVAAGEGELQSG